ncbi:sensor histidine kinase [Myxococcota bacterium]
MSPRRSQLLFLPLAPAIVVLVGVAAAVVNAWHGAAALRTQSDSAASVRAQVLSSALAERLRGSETADRTAVVERAASRSGSEVLLVGYEGDIVVDGTLGPPDQEEIIELLIDGEGETLTRLGRARYAVAPLGPPLQHLSVVAFVPAPESPYAIRPLWSSVATLTALLVGAAALAAFALARDVHGDVDLMRRRIVAMANAETHVAGKPVPVRAADQLGLLTSAFNLLVERFANAERAYQRDLAGSMVYDRMRSEFLAALSHELRTPMNAILGFTDVLLSETEGPLSAEARENLMVVRTSGQHLSALIDDILDFSALESGQLKLNCQQTDVLSVAADVVREAKVTAQWKPLVVTLSGQPTTAWVDRQRLRQILSNVVDNAVKFTSQGSVSVEIDGRKDRVLIIISDTGPGIEPAEQAAVFEEYRQGTTGLSGRVGSGLGLAITRRLVGMHGGHIRLESRLGEGSKFTIALPCRPHRVRLAT